jgi:hypothetical protein
VLSALQRKIASFGLSVVVGSVAAVPTHASGISEVHLLVLDGI